MDSPVQNAVGKCWKFVANFWMSPTDTPTSATTATDDDDVGTATAAAAER